VNDGFLDGSRVLLEAWRRSAFKEFGRSYVERFGELSDGTTLGLYLVPLDSDYGVNADSSCVRQLFLGQELAFADLS
jgi:hypothetical protein